MLRGFLHGRLVQLGRGAVKDTYSLLDDGIVKLLQALAAVEENVPVWRWPMPTVTGATWAAA